MLTTDPREPKSVLPGIDVPYAAKDVVQAKGMLLGPQFKALAPWSERLAIINGVRVNTANHHTGIEQVARLRTRTTRHSSAAFEILGAHRSGQTVGAVALGVGMYTAFTPSFIGQPSSGMYGSGVELFSVIDEMSPDDLELAAKTVERHAASLRRSGAGSLRDRRRLVSLDDCARLFRRLVDTPRFAKVAWHAGEAANFDLHSVNAQRALWLIENDLASSVTVATGAAWDTHFDTERKQGQLNPMLAANLVRLFQELDKRSNKYGRLSAQTAVMVGSEIGRFPYLNLSKGKDHFPQIPMVFFGKWFNTGKSYGHTDKELNSRPISLATGTGDRVGHKVTLDDVGATILRLGGLDPEIYGFDGTNLNFLVKS